MQKFRTVIGLTLLAALSANATINTRRGLNDQFYTGSGVGPLGLFRSSAENAKVVNSALRSHPVYRSLALAFGDEFPALRDQLIERAQGGGRYGESSSSSSSSSGGIASLLGGSSSSSSSDSSSSSSPAAGVLGTVRSFAQRLGRNPFFNYQNYLSYDRGNQKREYDDPYVRNNPLRAVTRFIPQGGISGLLSGLGGGSGGGGGAGGLLSSVTGLFSSFGGGGSSSSSSSSGSSGIQAYLDAQAAASGDSDSSASNSESFRITVDTPTRAPAAASANSIADAVEESAIEK